MSDGPPRKQSDLTIPIDRSILPPRSGRDLASIGLDPEHPETLELLERARVEMRERPTLERCMACEACGLCHGNHMVRPERNAAYEAADRDLTKIADEDLDE